MKHTIEPSRIDLLPDGRYGFFLLIDGKEFRAMAPASHTPSEANERMSKMVTEKQAIEAQKG